MQAAPGGSQWEFFEPITQDELQRVKAVLGIHISGELLALLKETNGIRDKRFGDYAVFDADQIIEYCLEHLEYVDSLGKEAPSEFLFFSDNGCGEHFGFEVVDGQIKSSQVGVYYPIGNEYRIVAPDLYTWAIEWYSGKLET